MKKILSHLMLVIAAFVALTASAQAVDQNKALQEISAAAATIKTMQCDFVQTKSLKMLGDKMVSKGNMSCQQPDKLLWEYTSPYTYKFVLNGAKVALKKGSRNDVIDVNQNKMFKEIARIMMNSVLGKCLTDKNDFKASVASAPAGYVVTLLPLKKEMKQMFTKIVLHYDKKSAMVTGVDLHEKNGDNTVIELRNIKKNQPVNAALFKVD